jgi:hypothetical protein
MKLHIALCLVIALPFSARGEAKELRAEHRRALEAAANFHPLAHTGDIPSELLALVAGRDGKIAEPGEKWEPTDAVSDTSLPAKRLIWAASDGHYYVVHYERGGIAHTYHLLIAFVMPNEAKPEFVWNFRTQALSDYSAFLAALRANTLDADRPRAR